MKIWTTCTLVSMLLFFPIGSCTEENQYRFPDKVTFPKEGGTVTVYGDCVELDVTIIAHNGDTGDRGVIESEDPENAADTLFARKDWLYVKKPENKAEYIISTTPNTSKRSRRLIIEGYNGYSLTKIYVIQE